MTPEKILEIASNPICCPCSPWWLKDEVKVGDVQQAAIAFANAIIAQARAELIAELKAAAWMRVHTTPGTPYGPAEHDIDIHVGDDMPNDGRPWTPLALIPDTKE